MFKSIGSAADSMGIFIDGPESLEVLSEDQVGFFFADPSRPSFPAQIPFNLLLEHLSRTFSFLALAIFP
jgi:hypothetical protein